MLSGIARPDGNPKQFREGSGEKFYDKSPKARSKWFLSKEY